MDKWKKNLIELIVGFILFTLLGIAVFSLEKYTEGEGCIPLIKAVAK